MITHEDFHTLAVRLVDRHGDIALSYADRAVSEMEALGEHERAEAWRALRSFVIDILEGRLDERPLTLN